MKDRTFNLAIAGFPYGGNGGISNEYPGVRNFLIEVITKARKDPRIDQIHQRDFSDTPITMTRNDSVLWARQVGADFLLMVDSDMQPDSELKEDPEAKPFWDTSFDFCMKHYDQGPNVVCAPYCGPPPVQNVYVFHWGMDEPDDPGARWRIDAYTREQAARMAGIQPVAAQPTGLILFDMRAFELTDPMPHFQELRKTHPKDVAMAMTRPWFYYEYESVYESQKCSTEDVTATRDISFHGHLKYNRDVIYCNWDAWAGHVKPKVVRKPRPISAGDIHAKYQHAVTTKQKGNERLVYIGAGEEQLIRHVREEQLTDIPRGADVSMGLFNDDVVRVGMYTHPMDLKALTDLVKECNPARAVEVGSWVGESARAICKGLSEDGTLICVDTFQGSPTDKTARLVAEHGPSAVEQAFLKNTKEYRESGQLQLWNMSDSDACKLYQHQMKLWAKGGLHVNYPIDFLYLDADHEYDFVKRQIESWTKCMSPEGVMAGHDFCDLFPGVMRAVQESFSEFTNIEGSNVWYAHVRDRKHHAQPATNGKCGGKGHAESQGGQGEHVPSCH